MERDYDLLNLEATELRLGLPGSEEPEKQLIVCPDGNRNNKRALLEKTEESSSNSNSCESNANSNRDTARPPAKAQIVGWPPVRSYRKNCLQQRNNKAESAGKFVKVSVDGAPYLRKIDLTMYKSYPELLKALGNMFVLTIGEYSEREGYNSSAYAPTYEDKDGDWMLVGDVPWEMFVCNCKRLRIMKGSEAKGLASI